MADGTSDRVTAIQLNMDSVTIMYLSSVECFLVNESYSSMLWVCREKKLTKLRRVMVNEVPYANYGDPEEHYVLTLDNAKKILAIHQRMR